MSKSNNQLADRAPGKGTLLQRFRLGSGLVLLAYVILHYVNHAAGHISLATMESLLVLQSALWGSWPGTAALYGALLVHVTLGLARLPTIRTWRRPLWEWAQIGLGLAIPWFLVTHIVYTRGAETSLGIEVDYTHELALLWPWAWIGQSFLLFLVWIHAAIGIHFWLRIRAGYRRWLPAFIAFAITLPLLAQTGWLAAARRQYDILETASRTDPAMQDKLVGNLQTTRFLIDSLGPIDVWGRYLSLGIIGLMLAIMSARWGLQHFARNVRVTYGDGTVVNAPPDQTLLDISRANGIPHMSVCGGRARCSTCRTLIIDGQANCSPVTEAESALLAKLSADDDIRLACQCRIRGDVQVRPLIQPRSRIAAPRNIDPLGWGVEREVAIFFLDIRGFSRISEKSLPYDVVFILNSVFGEIGAEIEASHGYIDKFMGDGLMAIFGLAASPREASLDAMRAALGAEAAARSSSRMLTHHLSEPIRVGIGVDTGTAVIGRIGRTSDQVSPSRLTAIGDTVNIAARLESATKELSTPIVLSRRAIQASGLDIGSEVGDSEKISVHNISNPVDILAVRDLDALRAKLAAIPPDLPGADRPRARNWLSPASRIALRGWTGAKKSG